MVCDAAISPVRVSMTLTLSIAKSATGAGGALAQPTTVRPSRNVPTIGQIERPAFIATASGSGRSPGGNYHCSA